MINENNSNTANNVKKQKFKEKYEILGKTSKHVNELINKIEEKSKYNEGR